MINSKVEGYMFQASGGLFITIKKQTCLFVVSWQLIPAGNGTLTCILQPDPATCNLQLVTID